MYRGLGQTSSVATPWGSPEQSGGSAFSNFVAEYAGWLLIAGLVVLAYATAPKGGR